MNYKLVPVEPTREMWAAAGDAVALKGNHHDSISEAVYKAILKLNESYYQCGLIATESELIKIGLKR